MGWLGLTAPAVLSERKFRSLSPDLCNALVQAGEESAVFERQFVVEGEAKLVEQVRELELASGVEIGGIDLAAPEDAEIAAILRGAVVERSLLVVRGQQHLSPAGYLGFAARFGRDFDLHSRRDLRFANHHETKHANGIAAFEARPEARLTRPGHPGPDPGPGQDLAAARARG